MMTAALISVAPMLDYTDRHFRYLIRLITRKAMLYTEMLTIKDILEDKSRHALDLNAIEHPIALQLGGSDPALLAQCAKLGARAHYDEINLNVGCPSSRVQSGKIGACLMLQPTLVAECVAAMRAVSSVPITVKCRLGVDKTDSYDHLAGFVETVAAAGCSKFIIHARTAWLQGLSPRQNREIPPLNYQMPYQLKVDFPALQLILNGGIRTLDAAAEHLSQFDGVMIGRAVNTNPFLLADVDRRFYQQGQDISEPEVVWQYMHYVEQELAKGTRLTRMTRHLLGLFHQKPRASHWRRHLSCNSSKADAGVNVIKEAMLALMSSS